MAMRGVSVVDFGLVSVEILDEDANLGSWRGSMWVGGAMAVLFVRIVVLVAKVGAVGCVFNVLEKVDCTR